VTNTRFRSTTRRRIKRKAFGKFLDTAELIIVLQCITLLALFLGWIFATVLKPLHGFLLRKKWGPKWAALCATFVATFMIILPLVGLGFVTVKNLIGLVSSYSKQGVDVDALVARVQGVPFVNQIFSDLGEFRSFLDENSKKGLGHLSDALASFIGAAPESILQLVLALLATYFFLLEGKKFSTWIVC
jgi:predicted PurR-regulated permease PerM